MAAMKLCRVGLGPAALRPATNAVRGRKSSCSANGGAAGPRGDGGGGAGGAAGVSPRGGGRGGEKPPPAPAAMAAGEPSRSPPYPVGSSTTFSLAPSTCSATTSANEVLGTTGSHSP